MNENPTMDRQIFSTWAAELWAEFARMGNHFIAPSKSDHSTTRGFMGENIDYYVALYSRDEFQSLSDFWLYNEYIDPIHYQILEGIDDLEWETMINELSDRSLARLYGKNSTGLSGGDELKKVLTKKAWLLPHSCPWILHLDILEGWLTVGSDTLECLAETEQGFLTIFAIID